MSAHGDGQRPATEAPKLRRSVGETDEAALWAAFAGADDVGTFCTAWLALQCRLIGETQCGLLLLQDGEARFTPAAIWPDRARDVTHLARTAQKALVERRGLVEPREDDRAEVAYPIEADRRIEGVVVLEVRARGPALQAALRQLHWGAGWLEALFRRRQAHRDADQIERSALALDLVVLGGEHDRLRAAATAIATDLAARLGCRRVAIGLQRRGVVRLIALSHTAWFEAETETAAALEAAMEEALDQDLPTVLPPLPETARRITVALADLARASGARTLAVVPLTAGPRSIGALVAERDDEPFDRGALQVLETAGHAIGPLLAAKAREDRLVSGRIVNALSDAARAVLGPRRPALKLAAATALAAVAWLSLATAEFRVTARAVIEGSVQRAAVAPFDGFVAAAPIRAGDIVEEGEVLARLDDRELRLEAARWRAEREQQLLRYQEAIGRQDRAQARILAAQIRQTEAQIALIEGKLERAAIRAPFRGVVISGDLSQQLGAPVEMGRVLFEIAPLDAFRVVLKVDERDLRYVRQGQEGRLVLTGLATDVFPLAVTKVTSVATAEEGRNVFRVEADLGAADPRLRPGMEGVAKLTVEDRALVWIWTRSLLDWLRLSLWGWLP